MYSKTEKRVLLGLIVIVLLLGGYLIGIHQTAKYYETVACRAEGYNTAKISSQWHPWNEEFTVTCFKETLESLRLK